MKELTATQTQDIAHEIQRNMARAFFASAWADMVEENGANLGGLEITNVLPRITDESAFDAARTLRFDMERANGKPIALIFAELCAASGDEGDRPHNPEMFGHYCAMQAMGHGVGLSDAFGDSAASVTVPYVEFGAYSLSKDCTFNR